MGIIAGQPTNFQPLWVFVVVLVLAYPPIAELFGEAVGQKTEEAPEALPGLSGAEREILRVLKQFSGEEGLYMAPELPTGGLSNARRSCGMPAAERVLALLDFTGDEDDASQSLLFGSSGIYFHIDKGSGVAKEITSSVPYTDFRRRSFVNHGKSVYLGDDVLLTPPEECGVSCETICNMLNALKQANVQGQQGP